MALTLQNPPCWRKCNRPREMCEKVYLKEVEATVSR